MPPSRRIEDEARELEAVREAVLRHLRLSFSALSAEDFEDIAQEALAELVGRRRAGAVIRNPVAFAKQVAWRDARDLRRGRQARPSYAAGPDADATADPRVDVVEHVALRAELARAIEAAERLTPEQKVVYRSRFVEGLKPRETCRALGLTRKQYYGRLERALASVEEALDADRFEELERELLRKVIVGSASAGERRRARRLLEADPVASRHARELAALYRGAAVALPGPIAKPSAGTALWDRIGDMAGAVRDRLVGRPGFDQAATQLSGTGAGRAGAAGAGGLVAQLAGASSVAKVAVGCLAAGAISATCVVTGLVPVLGGNSDADAPPQPPAHEQPHSGPAPLSDATLLHQAVATAQLASPKSPPSGRNQSSTSDRRSSLTGTVSPAVSPSTPAPVQEFDPVVSASPSPSPANAPGGAASSGDVAREFGP